MNTTDTTETGGIKILAVDDNPVNLKVVTQFLKNQGYEIITAASGEEAIEKFQSEAPSIILMDIMMPGMNGHEATQRIKELSGDKWIPIIFMSALSREEDKVKGLDVGGDDYITKPVEFSVLGAKIKAMQRIASMQLRLSKTMDDLQQYQQDAEREQETAHELMNRLFSAGQIESPLLQVWHEPATRFSGDLIVFSRAPGNRLYLLHADSTGHGLTAAVPLVPVSQIFYDMARKGYAIGHIVQKMNAHLKEFMPVNRFVALTLMLIDSDNNTVEVWNGGNPAALLVNKQGEVAHRFEPRHLALGIMPESAFDMRTEIVKTDDDHTVVLYSDGLVEAQNTEGTDFGEEGIMAAFKDGNNPLTVLDNITEALTSHLGECKAHDDVSLVVVSTAVEKTA